jgi:AcrR family transcriptional regulator
VARSSEDQAARILAVVVELLEREGYDAVQVRVVAAGARVSLATIYELFGNRDALVVAAVASWMEEHTYRHVEPVGPDEDPFEVMVRLIRIIFQPWEAHPNMLRAFTRASLLPGGESLAAQGVASVSHLRDAMANHLDDETVDDLGLILHLAISACMTLFAAGQMETKQIVPVLERILRRLAIGPTWKVRPAPAKRRRRVLRSS